MLEPVDLQLGDVRHRHPRRCRGRVRSRSSNARQLLFVVRVVQAEHRLRMPDRREPFGRASAYALRRRIERDEIGVFALETLELAHELVELGIADLWSGVDVVAVFVMADLPSKLVYAAGGIHSSTRSLARM